MSVFGLLGQILEAEGRYRGGFYEKLPEASRMSHRAITLLLAKAKSLRHSGNASGIIHSRSGKAVRKQLQPEESENV